MFLIFKEHIRTTGRRIRTLINWRLQEYDGDWVLTGYVLNGNEPGDGEKLRFTTTSPIVNRTGTKTLITTSGSEYTLDAPHELQDPEQVMEFPEP